jgi:hypothetical protein
MYDTATPTEYIPEGSEIKGSSVTYHFRIPFLNITAASGAAIQKLLLLPVDISDSNYAAEACAYFILDKPIDIPEASGNFTIIVD